MMIFARYIGGGLSHGPLTPGKVYPAKPEMDEGEMVSFNFIEIINDAGELVRVQPVVEDDDKRWDFEFVEEVYAVVTEAFEDFKVGDVVVVVDALRGGKRFVYDVKGIGWRHRGVVLLDRTNVFPGVSVLDLSTGFWEKIAQVDECLWIGLGGCSDRRSPEQFRFAVDRDGDILVEPLVVCMDVVGMPGLVLGGRYYVRRETNWDDPNDRALEVVDSDGVATWASALRFRR